MSEFHDIGFLRAIYIGIHSSGSEYFYRIGHSASLGWSTQCKCNGYLFQIKNGGDLRQPCKLVSYCPLSDSCQVTNQ